MRINGTTGPKAVLFSAHDTNIVLLLNFLKAGLKLDNFSYTNIEFASNVVIELNNIEANDTNLIKILYDDEEIYNDDYNQFLISAENYFASSIEKTNICGFENKADREETNIKNISSSFFWIYMYPAIIFILILVNIALFICIFKIKKSHRNCCKINKLIN